MSILPLISRSPIGLDLGAGCIKAVQLGRCRAGWRIGASATIGRQADGPLPTEQEVQRLADVLFSGGFVGASVVVGAPRAHLHSAVLDLPPRTSGAPVEQICVAEASRMFRITPGSYEMHAWEVPTASERSSTTQMAVNALEACDAEALVIPLEEAGFVVEAIDIAGEALCRACAPACAHDTDLTALLDIGANGVDMAIFRRGEVVYERWLQGRGVGRAAEAIAKSLGVDSAAGHLLLRRVGLRGMEAEGVDPIAIARLLSLTREYAEHLLNQALGSVAYVLDRFPGESVTRLRITGGGCVIPDLAPYLAELSGLEVEPLSPSDCAIGCAADQDRSLLMTAIGHALWRAA